MPAPARRVSLRPSSWSERISLSRLFSGRSLLVGGLALGACTTVVAFLALGAAQTLSQVPGQGQPMLLERYTLIGMTVAAVAGLGYLAIVKRVAAMHSSRRTWTCS